MSSLRSSRHRDRIAALVWPESGSALRLSDLVERLRNSISSDVCAVVTEDHLGMLTVAAVSGECEHLIGRRIGRCAVHAQPTKVADLFVGERMKTFISHPIEIGTIRLGTVLAGNKCSDRRESETGSELEKFSKYIAPQLFTNRYAERIAFQWNNDERARAAMELYDATNQIMFTIALAARGIEQGESDQVQVGKEKARLIIDSVEAASACLRESMRNLLVTVPSIDEIAGECARNYSIDHGIEVDVMIRGTPYPINEEGRNAVREAIDRGLSEVECSAATAVHIVLEYRLSELSVAVTYDGSLPRRGEVALCPVPNSGPERDGHVVQH